eukprot:gnl/MRDRNA2_/MRDRNA2_74505_c0_seq2.p1 gnl/MRDRNA2_/MRDRNA2_74505_c0~~gnl/MRDRNA2_/MRDRNA2_74505_c0_seq2.p1  ORF type:complete len:338 (+),score=69.27 gnl/MRDRNA2_/MRDRNA2_74505_c0_seq2:71-1084(+)
MGQQIQKCHTQEYRYVEEKYGEGNFQSMGERIDETYSPDPCESMPFHCSCCRTEEIEEAVVVHHDALRQVNFLLSYDELAAEELPGVPRCVGAVRQAKNKTKWAKRGIQVPLPTPTRPPAVDGEDNEKDGTTEEKDDAQDDWYDRNFAANWPQPPDGQRSVGSAAASSMDSASSSGAAAFAGQEDPSNFLDEVFDHANLERKELSGFLRRMRQGMALKMLGPKGEKVNSKDVMLRLVLSSVKHVFRIEADDLMETIPLHTVASVHVGGKHETDVPAAERELCMIMRTVWSSQSADGPQPSGGDEISYRFIFRSAKERDDFKAGMSRLRVFCAGLLDV